jgi:hypothetical protein
VSALASATCASLQQESLPPSCKGVVTTGD